MDLSRRALINPGSDAAQRPVLVLVDPAAHADASEIEQMLEPWVDGINADIRAIEDDGIPGDLAAWSSAHGELVVLVSDRPEIRKTVGLACQRLRIPLCRLELPAVG